MTGHPPARFTVRGSNAAGSSDREYAIAIALASSGGDARLAMQSALLGAGLVVAGTLLLAGLRGVRRHP